MNNISAFGSKRGSFIGPVANGDPGLDFHSSVRGVESESTSFFAPSDIIGKIISPHLPG